MGGVQAKPERRRPGLERKRKTSFTRNQRDVPITSKPRTTDDLCKHLGDFDLCKHLGDFDVCKYQADCKDDKELQDFDAELSTRAEEVIHSTGLVLVNQCLEYLTQSNKKSLRVISSCKKQILEAKGVEARMVMKAHEKLVDELLIREYFNNSLLTHQLCILELPQFINSAIEVHSCIAEVVRKREASEKLDESIKKYRHSAEAVVEKVNTLRGQHVNMLHKLKERIQKFDKKLERNRTLKKIVNVVFIGMLSGLFVCTIMAAAMAAPVVSSALTSHSCIAGVVAGGAVAYACSPVLKEGRHWLLTLVQGYESTLEAHKGVIKSMEAGSRVSIKELDAIMCHVNKVIAKGNDPVLANLSSANDEGSVDLEVIITEKLHQFHQEIEELDKRREQCLRVIEKERDQVNKVHSELKSSELWRAYEDVLCTY